MFSYFAYSHHIPCSHCGVALARDAVTAHTCNHERRLDYEMLQLRKEIAEFDDDLARWLASPQGRFEVWYARLRRAA